MAAPRLTTVVPDVPAAVAEVIRIAHAGIRNPDTTIGVPGNDNPNAGRITSVGPNWQPRSSRSPEHR